MTMKVVFIKEYTGHRLDGKNGIDEFKPLDEEFVPRKFGQKLILSEFAIPEFRKELNPEYRRLLKEKEKAEWKKKKEKAAAETVDEKGPAEEKKEPPKKRKYRKKAISKTAEIRETAVSLDENVEAEL